MYENLYTVTFRDGLYLVVDRKTGKAVTGHRRLEDARHSVLRHHAEAVKVTPRPEIDDLIRSEEESSI